MSQNKEARSHHIFLMLCEFRFLNTQLFAPFGALRESRFLSAPPTASSFV